MGLYRDFILPRGIAWGMSGKDISAERPRCIGRARGRVVEVGFGAGLNLPHYGEGVEELFAVEPARLNRKLAQRRIDEATFPVTWVGLEGESIPLEDDSADCVVSTWTLCTIPDLPQALSEMKRVLKPEGSLLFLEHGLSPDDKVARWQHRLNGFQKWWAGGCHLNRKIDALVTQAGFAIDELEASYMKGPKPVSYLYCGVARPASS